LNGISLKMLSECIPSGLAAWLAGEYKKVIPCCLAEGSFNEVKEAANPLIKKSFGVNKKT
jgi:hypothetical protein